jgi:hypothetical protein
VIDADVPQSSNRGGSRYNAVKHGLTAKTAVLPGEDAEAFQAKIDSYKSSLETRNPLEDDLAARAAEASWKLDRANGAEVARLARDILAKPAAESLRAELEAVALGQRLFFDRRGPTELYPSRDYDYKQPRTSWDDVPDDPDHPARLIPQLEATLAGCRLLLKFWSELRAVLELGLCWHSHEKLKCIRLLSKQPINAASSREVALVFLACHAVEPRSSSAFRELRCEIPEDRFKIHKADLDRWEQAGIKPADAKAGRAVLLRMVDESTARLRTLEATHQNLADVVSGFDTKILSFDESKSGDQLRRHEGSCNRLMLRNIEAIRKGRRDEAQGWGGTRKERERKKTEKRASSQLDERLVLDDEGNVCIAEDYDGDIEAALVRYDKALGYGTPRPRHAVANEVVPPVVPDFARWMAEEGRRKEGGERRSKGEDRAEPSFGDRGEGVQPMEVVPLVPEEMGERANLQNEIGEGKQQPQGLPDASGMSSYLDAERSADLAEGRSDAGASERRIVENAQEPQDIGNGPGTTRLIDVQHAAERHEERSDAGASQRGIAENEQESEDASNGSGTTSVIDVQHAAERHEERSDAGASERGIAGNELGSEDVGNGSGTRWLIDVQHAAERHEDRSDAGASERENETVGWVAGQPAVDDRRFERMQPTSLDPIPQLPLPRSP